ncbi:MAG: AMP-binding protein [Vicinamibacterales bacterium]|jgi:1-acyl-sn-glycerol-3-phosphate acyltransferase|nr:AMP-binding protein [Vicinamibacterales bacterium]MDP7480459.1 AMP-binding protein [Vicinamibacterales bacterium]MDP7691900.1 AMP-binding protein [Vicinamibacterales bacterium]HJN45856.1 AMP-binding protein [Vicinamibacterales bacterium]
MTQPTPVPDEHAGLERHILQLVGQLVGELRPGSPTAGIGPDDSLERELGIGSLERVELLTRIERGVGVRLADSVMATADTPADLVRAVAASEPAVAETLPAVLAPVGAATPAPSSAATLLDVLQWHAQTSPDRTHVFLRQDDGTEQPITYAQLWQRAVAVAAALRARGIGRRDTVTIMLRTEAAFFQAFFGTLLAGAIPVPIYPPFRADRIAEYAQRQVGILSNAGTRLMITFAEVERLAGLLRGQIPTLTAVTTLDDLASPTDDGGPLPAKPPVWLTAEDPALIQYTSGSTGQPKGVLLTHANLLANIRAIGDGLDISRDDIGVSWLPLYHDMGLIGAWLGTLYFGVPVAILSPLAFLSRPARWLWTIHAHRATLSVAPNFAFDLCVNKVSDAEIEGLDLSSLRVVLNGSEAVLPETLTRFAERFAAAGFRPDAMRPVYGLAECSVGLAVTPRRHPARVDRVARGFQLTGQAVPSDDTDALSFVSCGVPLPRHEIRTVDPTGASVAERIEGRVQFRGPSMMAGYYRNEAATRAITTDDGWIDSGDLGYLADAELFLTGRRKDVVIKGGRNIYPHEAEGVVAAVDGVRKGCIAVFGIADAALGTERLVVVAETRETGPAARDRLHQRILEEVSEALGVPPDIVELARPGAVLKTSSGKVRRGATRDAFLAGTLNRGAGSMARQWLTVAWRAIAARIGRSADLFLRVAYTTYIVILLLVLVPPLWGLVRMSGRRVARGLLSRFSRLIVAVSGCRLTVSGLEHLRDLGPAIFVANHASYLDVLVMLAVLPRNLRFAAKARLATYPVLGTVIPRAGYIAIEKTKLTEQVEGADEVSAALGAGESMFVFPEGTFVRSPGLLPFRLGAFRAAAETGRSLVPVAISGTRHIFPAGTLLLRPGRITLAIQPALEPRDAGWNEVVRLRDEARRVIARNAGETV